MMSVNNKLYMQNSKLDLDYLTLRHDVSEQLYMQNSKLDLDYQTLGHDVGEQLTIHAELKVRSRLLDTSP